ncbi:MAG: DNA photolyase family protein [Xanthomonadales bacterium]|jgi:deoxyribodipyrimidine photo-lyase|nr:DNA photolyase family protein [Xanthomonadales bacterium]
MHAVQLVWFKRDLRVADHAPLCAARDAGPVLPLYVVEPGYWQQPEVSGRQYAFLSESLAELREALARRGQPLIVRVGRVTEVLEALATQVRIGAVHAHAETGNGWTYARDREVAAWLRGRGIPIHEHWQTGVIRGLQRRAAWAQHWEQRMAESVLPAIGVLPTLDLPLGDWPDAAALGLAPDPCPGRQRGGRRIAVALLQSFLTERAETYQRGMSSPISAEAVCSRLSPHLALGTVSVREVLAATRRRVGQLGEGAGGFKRSLRSFDARLHWHCHFIQKLESEPEIEFHNIHRGYDGMREADFSPAHHAAWARGESGWPFVDACMRMLAATGWINFRMRAMLVAMSSYHLWNHWREPGLHLARQFTDYEPGIHWPQVQMQSGVTGINIPRIYNPIKQSQDQDPTGEFIRRWIPELAAIPEALIHTPWLVPPAQQQRLGVIIGRDYPAPIVDHEQAARSAKVRLSDWRRRPGMLDQSRAVLAKHGSRKRRVEKSVPKSNPQPDLFGGP